MRLVHRHQWDLDTGAEVQKPLRSKPLRGDVQYLVHSRQCAVQHLEILPLTEGAVYVRGADSRLLKPLHLILHQRYQRGDHDSRSPKRQRRDLVAHGFSRTGGHYPEAVLPGKDMVDQLHLPRAECAVSEILFKQLRFVHVYLT